MTNVSAHTPLVSVISLVYRNAPLLLDAFPTLHQQTLRDFEQLILVNGNDDGSGDRVEAEWVARQPFARTIWSPTNLGICRGLNRAISEARGRYLTFFTDDRWEPDHLEVAADALERAGDDAAVFFCPAHVANAALDVVSRPHPAEQMRAAGAPRLASLFAPGPPRRIAGGDMLEVLLRANVVPAVAVMIRRHTFDALGRYDERLPFEDYEFSLRVSLTHDWVFSPRATATYVQHGRAFSAAQPAIVSRGAAASILQHRDALATRGLGALAAEAVCRNALRAAYSSADAGRHDEAWNDLREAASDPRRLRPRQLASVALAAVRLFRSTRRRARQDARPEAPQSSRSEEAR